jgi:hypothetical protein
VATRKLTILVFPGRFAVCRLAADSPLPPWAQRGGFISLTRTEDELSTVCAEENISADVRAERGWRCLKLQGPFAFDEIGVLASVTEPLAQAGISLFAISTFDTDYVLVKEADLERASATLREAGHLVPA